MRLLYGTYNPAKLAAMRSWLDMPVSLIGLSELESLPADVEETGETPLENACIKARAYCRASGMLTLAADSALYLEGLSDAEQPAVHARRVGGTRMNDEEMIGHYAGLVHAHGGRMTARYRNGACVMHPDGRMLTRFDDSLASAPFYLVDTPHPQRTKGFPLDSLSVHIESGQYYYDLGDARMDADLPQRDGFRTFVREAIEMFAHEDDL
ncbi:hypothetical protein LJC74_00395 [Eubacteriales bacterium OttesenSCG-928-A19]|nr:hypothetical protein [Eubacteriales bacterium OttesenSCG-928-A19]